MEATIRECILRECDKLIRRYHLTVRQNQKDQGRFRKRTGATPLPPKTYEPSHWQLHDHFNPFYVRQRADTIAHSIARKIRTSSYAATPALGLQIPKPAGGVRELTVFTIPDAAVSYYLFKTLRGRNQQIFSSYAYAYRGDRSTHHAIQHLASYVKSRARLYLVEYDFARYFDTIGHDYLKQVLERRFRVSPRENAMLQTLLSFKRAKNPADYKAKIFRVNQRGIPQGSSISLFLANIACVELDQEIERLGSVFARYADDTVILCDTYDMAHRCAELLQLHGARSQTEINFEKSDGISLLTLEPRPEMRSKSAFDFVGYRISQLGTGVARKTVARIKRKISAIIYRHLLLYPRRKGFSRKRVEANGVDWDMVTCINEIRRYLYGEVTEKTLSNCLNNKSAKLILSKSLLSYYPLVDDPSVFRELDGWLLNVIQRAQRQRKKTIAKKTQKYRTYTKAEILSGSWYSSQVPNETRLPSFFRAWLYVRRLMNVYDLSHFPTPKYGS